MSLHKVDFIFAEDDMEVFDDCIKEEQIVVACKVQKGQKLSKQTAELIGLYDQIASMI